ncbi:unnamed protein product [Blepharisma stoltei]|uniref:GOLD domain-containing protein n=1 Tax=Blepharisma stoltei TaxID=1481888 RepID=A0AAU9K650_9CILI|nr:unnamed protein product [Blepharisma stoltei]
MIIFLLIFTAFSYEIKIAGKTAACLIKTLPRGSVYAGECGTKLWRPDLKYLSVQVINTRSQYTYTSVHTNSAKFKINTDEAGPYSICVTNTADWEFDIVFKLTQESSNNGPGLVGYELPINATEFRMINQPNGNFQIHNELKDIYDKVREEREKANIKEKDYTEILWSVLIFGLLGVIVCSYLTKDVVVEEKKSI